MSALILVLSTIVVPSAVSARDTRPIRLVALGDSLVAGYGISRDAAFPAVLERTLRARGYDATVTNAGVSGDTASGGYARVDASVPDGTDGVILELGANDMLQSVDPAVTRNALAAIVGRLRQRGIPVLLAGMRALPRKGARYVARFESIYPSLARSYGLTLYPFFLQNVVYVNGLNQADGVHPNPVGVQRIVGQMLPTVERFLARIGSHDDSRGNRPRSRRAAPGMRPHPATAA